MDRVPEEPGTVQIVERLLARLRRQRPPGLRTVDIRGQIPWLFAACAVAFSLASLAPLAWLGAFTVLFTLDDRFLLHEIVLPWVLGLPETATFALYGGLLALVLGWDTTGRRVAEEVAKLVGAVVWSSFPAAIIARYLRRAGAEHSPR